MVEPYQAVGLVPTMRGIRRRDEIAVNIEHVSHLIKAASWLSSLDLPVRLIAVPEGALQGFNDEVLDLDHEEFARECAIDIPGPETDALGALARQWNAYLMAQAKARHPEFPGRFFNVGFILSPDGDIIMRHHKLIWTSCWPGCRRSQRRPARRTHRRGCGFRRSCVCSASSAAPLGSSRAVRRGFSARRGWGDECGPGGSCRACRSRGSWRRR